MPSVYSNPELEAALLGAALKDTNVVRLVRPEYFSLGRHILIAKAIATLGIEKKEVDYFAVEAQLKATNELDAAGGVAFVCGLTDRCPSASMAESYADRLHKLSLARHMRSKLAEATECLDKIPDPFAVAPRIAELSRHLQNSSRRNYTTATVADAFQQIERWQEAGEIGVLPTGFLSFDREYAPAPGELVIIGSRPSIGKTSLLINIAENIAQRQDPILFFSAEMSPIQIHHRRLAAESGLSISSIRRPGVYRSGEWDRIGNAAGKINKRPFRVFGGRHSVPDIVTGIRSGAAENPPVIAAFIDHLGLLDLPRAERQDLRIGEATSALAAVGKETGVTIFLAAQLNRMSEKGGESGKPMIVALRDSGRIEEDADIVVLLYRPTHYEMSPPDVQDLELDIGKNRNGPLGIVTLAFNLVTGRISDR